MNLTEVEHFVSRKALGGICGIKVRFAQRRQAHHKTRRSSNRLAKRTLEFQRPTAQPTASLARSCIFSVTIFLKDGALAKTRTLRSDILFAFALALACYVA